MVLRAWIPILQLQNKSKEGKNTTTLLPILFYNTLIPLRYHQTITQHPRPPTFMAASHQKYQGKYLRNLNPTLPIYDRIFNLFPLPRPSSRSTISKPILQIPSTAPRSYNTIPSIIIDTPLWLRSTPFPRVQFWFPQFFEIYHNFNYIRILLPSLIPSIIEYLYELNTQKCLLLPVGFEPATSCVRGGRLTKGPPGSAKFHIILDTQMRTLANKTVISTT